MNRVIHLNVKTPNDLTCALSPDRSLAVTGVAGRSVHLWHLDTGDCLREFTGHTERVWGLAWSADGRYVLSGAWDHTARLWDATSGACLQVLNGHAGFVRALSFSGDGRRAITASGRRTVRVWDLQSGRSIQTLRGHTDGVYCAVLPIQAERAISGSRDGTVRVWNVETGECLRAVAAHGYRVQALSLRAGHRRLTVLFQACPPVGYPCGQNDPAIRWPHRNDPRCRVEPGSHADCVRRARSNRA